MAQKVHVSRKPSGPIGRMEMEKDPIGTRDVRAIGFHRMDGLAGTHDTQAVESHRSDGDGERFHRYT